MMNYENLGSRFKVQGSRFKVQGSRFKVQGSRFLSQDFHLIVFWSFEVAIFQIFDEI